MEETAEDGKSTIAAKRLRHDDDVPATGTKHLVPSKDQQDDAVTREADAKLKKRRLETPPTTTDSATNDALEPIETGDIDAEAELMRALEEAIERDAAAPSKGAIPTIVDEDDDYDESD